MLIHKKPYEFWNFRDTRKTGLPKIPVIDLPKVYTDKPQTVKGYQSHSILLPLKNLPEALIKRLKNDLTLVNPEYVNARKYGKGFVSYAIPEFVYLYTIDNEYIGLPRSIKLPYLHNRFKDCGLSLDLQDVRPEFEKITWEERGIIKPLFYQEEAIKQIVDNNVIMNLKCGKGKTILASLAIAKIRLKTLILVRNSIIQSQWIEALTKVFNITENDLGIINGDVKREGPITVAMGQSLMNYSREEKKRIGESFGHIIYDEVHEWASQQAKELLPYFKAKKTTGLTATVEREDKMEPIIKSYIGQVVSVDDLGDIKSVVHLRKTKFAYDFVGKKDKYHELINALVKDADRNQQIVDTIKEYLAEGHTLLTYSCRIQHMETIRNMLKDQAPGVSVGVLASAVDGHALSPEEQNALRNDIKDHKVSILVSGKMAEQGFDAPCIDTVFLTTPTKSRRLILQVWGRAQREYLGKKESILIDLIDKKTKILLYQFFAKNKRIYKNHEKSHI